MKLSHIYESFQLNVEEYNSFEIMKLWNLLSTLAVIQSSSASVDLYISNYGSYEKQSIISSSNMQSEDEQLPNFDYEIYRPYVTRLASINSEINYIPTGFFSLFYNVKSVEITNSRLLAVTRNTFKNGKNITSINLSNNQISSVPVDAFADCEFLTTLNLYGNRLTEFDINFGASFRSSLKTISLSYNQISAFNPAIFDRLPFFERLELYSNPCVSGYFTKPSSSSFKSSVDFAMSSCFFNWANLPKPTTPAPSSTNSRECKYTNHPVYGYTCTFVRLVYTDISLDKFKISGTHLPGKQDSDVTGVYFQRSTLVEIPSKIFKKFANLEYVDASFAGIEIADKNTLKRCDALKHLDLRFNNIKKIEEGFLKDCNEIMSVDLSDNLIQAISPCKNFLKRMLNLKEVFLSGNICASEDFVDQNLSANYGKVLDKPLRTCQVNYVLGDEAPTFRSIRRIPEEFFDEQFSQNTTEIENVA